MATLHPGARIDRATRTRSRSHSQLTALVLAAVYLLIGLVGWFVTTEFVGVDDDAHLLGFHLNGVHNVVHLTLGAVWLAASTRVDWSRAINTLFGAVLVVVCLAGIAGVLDELLNIDGAGEPDNYLHLVTGAVTLWAGTAGAERRSSG